MSKASRPQAPKVRDFGPKQNDDCEVIKLKGPPPSRTKHKQKYNRVTEE